MARVAKAEVFIGVAAVADYRPKEAEGAQAEEGQPAT